MSILFNYKKIFKSAPFLFDLIWFIIILFGFHYLWKYWEANFDFHIFGYPVLRGLYDNLLGIVFSESTYVLDNILGISFTSNNYKFYFDNGTTISIVYGCTGVKASIQFIILILLFRGNFAKKLIFILIGLIIIHIVNLARIVGLSLVMINWVDLFELFHQNIFRPIFYAVIFLLWVI